MITRNTDTLKNISLDFTGTPEEYSKLINLLEFELRASNPKGVGLSAIQINIPLRVAIIRHDKVGLNLYNTEIIDKSQPFIFKGEGCLSFPGQFINTKRYNQITIRNGNGETASFSGFTAIAIQHEIAHWSGETMFDYEVQSD